MNITVIHQLLERIGNLLRNETRACLVEHGLLPVQLDALCYLSICNRFSDTPKAVTEYLGLTKGTVSQSLKVLENKGYVSKTQDPNDKRITHITLTAQGEALIAKTQPSQLLKKVWEDNAITNHGLDGEVLQQQLESLLLTMQQQNQCKSFGVCKTCKHNQTLTDGTHLCGLTQLALSRSDIQKICIEHSK
ncbi:MarR family winged helix-turn-helix transcriptional regulator [Photobacterium leiognathi]|uniref:MarR family winged helix-turn-helix transcriptional regulator n=1 Tax=Photobacterium leiognathi TaxID=553611 RepID=UPI000D17D220|nr:MarR family winged helix-turn-helix transcriptional regulator [Photobacterium leiognathi]PSW44720.1 MarR family transcriptional regulator [Photobacterium leiognathi subsp. mandapamensis]